MRKETTESFADQKIPLEAKAIIAVASGKGGVGKSTVSVNLALSLAKKGLQVGLLDADVYGPNVPLMLGLENVTAGASNEKIIPVEKYGMKIMSVAFMVEPDKALIWRGPLANRLIEQFLGDVEWGKLDVLVIDLPPGTGDVPLSIIQKTNLSGGVIVTTPQEAAIADVRKMINMFENTDIPILGIVENMKYIQCPGCSESIELYPNKDNRGITEVLGHELLAEFPFVPGIGLKETDGTPYYLSQPDSETANRYNQMGDQILKQIPQLEK